MSKAVSVIIPVYNVEKYIDECVASAMGQTLEDIEIILVDDGSPDRCGKICDLYAAKDPRVKVIHQKNGGISAARNAGIAAAEGKYVMFIDGDDSVEPDFCRIPYEEAEQNDCDTVIFCYNTVVDEDYGDYKAVPMVYVYPDRSLLTKAQALTWLNNPNGANAWNKMTKREIALANPYPLGRTFEDVATTYKYILDSDRITVLNERLYNYRIRKNSIVRTLSPRNISDHIAMFLYKYDDLSRRMPEPGDEILNINKIRRLALTYLIYFGDKGVYSERSKDLLYGVKSAPGSFDKKGRLLFALFKHCRPLFDLACRASGKRIDDPDPGC